MKIARGKESPLHLRLKTQVVEAVLASGEWIAIPEHRFADVAAVSIRHSEIAVAIEVECTNLRGFLGNLHRNKRTGFREQWIVVTSTLARNYVEAILEKQPIITRCFLRGVILPSEISETIMRLRPRHRVTALPSVADASSAHEATMCIPTSKP